MTLVLINLVQIFYEVGELKLGSIHPCLQVEFRQHLLSAAKSMNSHDLSHTRPNRQPRERAPAYVGQTSTPCQIGAWSNLMENNAGGGFSQHRLPGGRSHQTGNLRPANTILSASVNGKSGGHIMIQSYYENSPCQSQVSAPYHLRGRVGLSLRLRLWLATTAA